MNLEPIPDTGHRSVAGEARAVGHVPSPGATAAIAGPERTSCSDDTWSTVPGPAPSRLATVPGCAQCTVATAVGRPVVSTVWTVVVADPSAPSQEIVIDPIGAAPTSEYTRVSR